MNSHRIVLISLLAALVLTVGATTALAGAPKVTGSSDTNCVLSDAGAVSCWGENYQGVLGDGSAIVDRHNAAPVIGLGAGVIDIGVGTDFACAVRGDGKVLCWGDNSTGVLTPGTPDDNPHATPVEVAGVSGATRIATGHSGVCALLSDGTGRCWGHNYYGQAGDGQPVGQYANPITKVLGLSNIVKISAANFGFCALLADNKVSCWGNNWDGALGREPSGFGNHSSTPTLVPGITTATELVGGDTACVKLADGSVKCWGDNDYFQLGNQGGDSSTPLTVPGAAGFTALLGTNNSKCILLPAGTYSCWGYNGHAQFLPNQSSIQTVTPVSFSGEVITISSEGDSSSMCWVVRGGAVHCRGSNYAGEGGSPVHMNSGSPDTVVPGADAITNSYGASSATLTVQRKIKADKKKRNYLLNADAGITPSPLVAPAGACVGSLAGTVTYSYTKKKTVRKNGKKTTKKVKVTKKWKSSANLALTGATCTARLSFKKLPVKTLNRKRVVVSAVFAGNSELPATSIAAKTTKLPKITIKKKKSKK